MMFPKTAKAFLAEENVLWDVIDALAEEMPGDCSAGSLGECVEYLKEQGVEKAAKTIAHYRLTGTYMDSASADDRRVLRGQSATTVVNFAVYSVPPSRAVHDIKEYQSRTGRKRMGSLVVRELHSAKSSLSRQIGEAPSDPETWTAAHWAAFDKKVSAAAELIMDAALFRRNGWYVPSVEAIASLNLVRREDIDAELAALVGEA